MGWNGEILGSINSSRVFIKHTEDRFNIFESSLGLTQVLSLSICFDLLNWTLILIPIISPLRLNFLTWIPPLLDQSSGDILNSWSFDWFFNSDFGFIEGDLTNQWQNLLAIFPGLHHTDDLYILMVRIEELMRTFQYTPMIKVFWG